jgi:3-phenylpropionate/trans-cinnamate dioxygenase ferredoxin reductase component
MTRYAIIGTGIAGISAAQTLRSLEPGAEITLVSEDTHGFYSRPGLAYYLTGEIPEKQLFPNLQKGKHKQEVQDVIGRVTRIDPRSHTLEINPHKGLRYDRLLLATGAKSVSLDVPGNDLQGVIKLDDLEDVRTILSLIRHSKTAVVVGGGVLGIEMVEGLAAQNVKVHYLLRGDWYWSNVLVEPEARMLERNLIREGVTLHHHSEIVEILGKKGKVIGVRTSTGEVIRCDMVGVGIGVRACTELAIAAGLQTERGILVNEYLQTSDPDIFAAGDVSQIYDPLTGRSSIDNLWYPGRKQGRAAGLNMAGQPEVYQRAVAVNVLLLAHIMTTIIGAIGSGRDEGPVYTTRGSSESWLQLPNTIATENRTDVSQLRLMVGENSILGALVMGDQKIARPIRELINNQVDITPIRDKLLHASSDLGQSVMDFWIKTRR